MIANKIVTPGNQEWGALYLDEPRVLRFYGAPKDNERAKWKWVNVKELMRSLIEFHYASKQRSVHKSDPNLTLRELINNFRPLFVLQHLHLGQYQLKMNYATPFLVAKLSPDNENMLVCDQISPLAAVFHNPEEVLVPFRFSENVRELIIGLGMYNIDDIPPSGHSNQAAAGQPPTLWAHSLAGHEHVMLSLAKGSTPRWTWGDVIRTPLGAE